MAVGGLFSLSAQAQDSGGGLSVNGSRVPAQWKAGGVFVTPTVEVQTGHTNNVTYAPLSSAIASDFVSVRPTLKVEALKGGDKYEASYAGTYDRYNSSSADNTNNHDVRVLGQNYLTSRLDASWGLRYQDAYEARNLAVFAVAPLPSRYTSTDAQVRIGYGAEGALGRVEGYAGIKDKVYQNNRTLTAGYDLQAQNVGGTFYFKAGPKTSLTFDLSHTKNDYKLSTSTLDNNDDRLSVGAVWEALAATTGSIKLGYQTKRATTPNVVADFKGFSYEADVTWRPISYSEINFSANRTAADPVISAPGFTINTGLGLGWNHAWRSYLQSRITVSQVRSEYLNSARVDSTNGYTASLMYDATRWLGLGIEYSHQKRDSTIGVYSFNVDRVMLKAAASL